MAVHDNLDDFVNHVTFDTNNTGALSGATPTMDSAVFAGPRYTSKRGRAEGFASVDETTGVFTGARTGTQDVMANLESLGEFRETAQQLKEAGVSGRASESLLKNHERLVKESGKRLLSDASKAAAEDEKALALLDERKLQIKDQLSRRVTQEQRRLTAEINAMPSATAADIATRGTRQVEGNRQLLSNHSAAIDALETHFQDLKTFHTDRLSALNNVADEVIKETGTTFNKADFFKGAAPKVGADGKTVTMTQGTFGAMKSNPLLAVGAVVGTGAFLHGASQLMGSGTNPDGTPQDKTGALVETVAGAGVGGFSWAKLIKEGKVAAATLAKGV